VTVTYNKIKKMNKKFRVLILKKDKSRKDRKLISRSLNDRPFDAVLVRNKKAENCSGVTTTLYCIEKQRSSFFFAFGKKGGFQAIRDTRVLPESKEMVISLMVWGSPTKIKNFLEKEEKSDERGRYSQYR
jgi:hypothetical protein